MKALIVGTSFLPNYGGPALSVSGLARALAEAGVTVGLWAPDGSALTSSILGPHFPARRLGGSPEQAIKQLGQPDVLHDSGIWLPHNHSLAKLAKDHDIPRIVSLRGMVAPWALNYRKWKKRLAWHLYQKRDLQLAQYHHATADEEAAHVKRLGLGVPICVVSNGIDLPAALPNSEAHGLMASPDRRRIALFLSRIHPVKGVPMLIEAWTRVRPAGWELHLAGPDETGHVSQIQAQIKACGLSDRVHILGPVSAAQKATVFAQADLFVLPTHSENFGMVIAEALAHGVPVLTTKGAPWPMLADRRCGWWVEASAEGIVDGLMAATSCVPEELCAMGQRGRALIEEQFCWPRIGERFVTLYEDLLR